jgi:sensor histidine kinase YesM
MEQTEDGVKVTITDNGMGMSAAEHDALLALHEPPVPAPAKKNSMGIGTRNVIKRLRLFYSSQDIVYIESEPGRGTSVILLLPASDNLEQKGE